MISNPVKLYLLASEMLPICDNIPVEGIKLKRSVNYLMNYLESYTKSANDVFEGNDALTTYHETMVLNFGKIMDNMTLKELTLLHPKKEGAEASQEVIKKNHETVHHYAAYVLTCYETNKPIPSYSEFLKRPISSNTENHTEHKLEVIPTMSTKQTAVDWLIDKLKQRGLLLEQDINQAKEIDKQQKIDAVIYGNRQEFYDGTEMIGEQYYRQTYE